MSALMKYRIPDLTEQRQKKSQMDYEAVPYSRTNQLWNDELVNPNDFGLEAQTFYAPKLSEKEKLALPLLAVPQLRKDVVNRLVRADEFLRKSSRINELLGFNCRIAIRDCLRTLEMQRFAYEEYWPNYLLGQDSTLSGEKLKAEVRKYCAPPTANGPHLSGGAVDVALINLDTGEFVDRGSGKGYAPEANFPDYYEGYSALGWNKCSAEVLTGRRVLFYAMTEIAGLVSNPTEIWHYGLGDKLSAYLTDTAAYYGAV